MTYGEFITDLRNQSGDTRRRIHVDFIGDGSTTIFQMPTDTFPVLDDTGTYVVKVNGSVQTETTDYTLYKNEGTIALNTAPADGIAVAIDASAVYLTDDDWIAVLASTVRSLGDDFWTEFVDEDNFTTAASMTSLDLTASRPNCIAVYEFQDKTNSGDNWGIIETRGNWRYDRENNIIYIGKNTMFPTSNVSVRIRGLETYTIGDSTDDDISVQSRFHTILEYGALARYWRYRYKSVVELVSKMTTESTRTPLQELIMLSDRFDRLYEIEKGKLKPQKPSRIIPRMREDGGRP